MGKQGEEFDGRCFVVSKEEQRAIALWAREHDCDARGIGAAGGRITYCFTPTGLGICTAAKCVCGDSIDVTACEGW